MREIKYQGWLVKEQKMYPWEDIVSNKVLLQSFFGNEFFATHLPQYLWERRQYTGLKDKNGKEIYEGDIVDYELTNNDRMIAAVAWNKKQARFSLLDKEEAGHPYWGINEFDVSQLCKVIGNIYEHPELLEGKQ